tara:strand:+ start:209 stop:565 length:357 start_codon:yes stop_codon:yes gene_type:complete
MIENFGIGTDLVYIKKFEKMSFSIKPSFYKKIFLPSEIEYCLKFKNSAEHFAGKFAIKEAVKKSIDDDVSFLDIETFHIESKLKVELCGDWKNKYKILGSISHEKDYALGMAFSEKII